MNVVVCLLLGGSVGWLISLLASTDARQGVVENIIAGTVGALAGAYFIGPLVGVGAISHSDISGASLIASLIGAAATAFTVRFLRHVNAAR